MSEGVTIQYDLMYTAKFWNDVNKTRTDSRSHTWCGLRSGTTYDFYVSVFAGERNSENITEVARTGKLVTEDLTTTQTAGSGQKFGWMTGSNNL